MLLVINVDNEMKQYFEVDHFWGGQPMKPPKKFENFLKVLKEGSSRNLM